MVRPYVTHPFGTREIRHIVLKLGNNFMATARKSGMVRRFTINET